MVRFHCVIHNTFVTAQITQKLKCVSLWLIVTEITLCSRLDHQTNQTGKGRGFLRLPIGRLW